MQIQELVILNIFYLIHGHIHADKISKVINPMIHCMEEQRTLIVKRNYNVKSQH